MGSASIALGAWQIWNSTVDQRAAVIREQKYRDELSGLRKEMSSIRLDNSVLKREIADKDKILARIAEMQLDLAQKEFALSYSPCVDITYQNKRINIYNKGKANLRLWGTQLAGGIRLLEKRPRIISPDGSYFLFGDHLDQELQQKLPANDRCAIPFDVFLEDALSRKYTVKELLFAEKVNGQIEIHTQNTGIIREDWSKSRRVCDVRSTVPTI